MKIISINADIELFEQFKKDFNKFEGVKTFNIEYENEGFLIFMDVRVSIETLCYSEYCGFVDNANYDVTVFSKNYIAYHNGEQINYSMDTFVYNGNYFIMDDEIYNYIINEMEAV